MGFYDAIRVGASGAAEDFTVDRSLRFNRSDSAQLSRTFGSAGNRRTFTFSAWIKISFNSNTNAFFSGQKSGEGFFKFMFRDDHRIEINTSETGSDDSSQLKTTRKFRDPSAWFHLVVAYDTTQGTASDRVKIYVNGTQETAFDTGTYPSQNHQHIINIDGDYQIGNQIGTSNYFGGYMVEVNFIDGLQLDPSSFAETDATTGQWNPKKYVGSYGTNGFYLNFSDNSGTTATTLGKDSSGNGNNFTPNNFAVSDSMPDTPTNNFATMNPLNGYSGLSEGNLRFNNYNDSAGNRSVQASIALPKSGKWYWEARYQESGTGTVSTKYFGLSQIQMATGYITAPYVYYEGGSGTLRNGNASDNKDGKQVWYNGTGVPAVLAIAVDVDNNSVEYFHNGSSQGTIPLPTLTSSQEYFFTWANTSGGSSSSLNDTFNFGADSTFQGQISSGGNTDANGIGDFKYAPPSGHLALNSANLPDPTILLPNNHFNTLLYTGNGTDDRDITGLNFQPDWLWIKERSGSDNHLLFNSIIGTSDFLNSNNTNAQGNDPNALQAFNSDGFQVGTSSEINENTATYVAWNWNAGDTDGKTYTVTVVSDSGNKYRFDGFGTSAVTLDLAEGGTYIFNYPSAHPLKFSTTSDGTHGGGSEYTTGVTHNSSTQVTIVVAASAPTLYYYCGSHSGMGGQVNTNSTLGSSNFDGTIQSTVKVNATAGFSITTYTGTGSSTTVGHGLGVKPDAIIIKCRSNTDNWMVYHNQKNGGVDPEDYYLELNSTSAGPNSTVMLNDTAPTSTSVTIGSDNSVNGSSRTYVMYCFSGVAGYSKFGSYTGNGSSDGTFVFTGFRPAWVMFKSTSNAESWQIKDNKRVGYNDQNHTLFPNNTSTEYTTAQMDLLSNGFKLRNDGGGSNGSGETLIYLAFAESPFKNARAR